MNWASGRHRRRRSDDRGVALVEFAIVAPLLLLLLFGIIEFGWTFLQYLDVRHGAREGARLAAVNYDPDRADLLAETCARMDSSKEVFVRFDQSGPLVGNPITVTVSADLDTLTGFLDPFLGGIDLESTVEIRAEQAPTWTETPSTPARGEECP